MELAQEEIPCDSPHCQNITVCFPCQACKAIYYCSESCQAHDANSHVGFCEFIQTKSVQEFDHNKVQDFEDQMPFLFTLKFDQICEEKEAVCAICLDNPFQQKRAVVTLKKCQHSFCLTCIANWQRYSEKDCPRAQFDLETFDFNSVSNFNVPNVVYQEDSFDSLLTRISPYRCDDEHIHRCPFCRDNTEHVERCLINLAKGCIARSQERGCPMLRKEQLLHQALEYTSVLLDVKHTNLNVHYLHAEVLLSLNRPQEAAVAVDQLVQIDKARHIAIQQNPVLAWIECARDAYEYSDFTRLSSALTTAAEQAARFGWPPKPAPSLFGKERLRLYQAAYLLQAEAFGRQGEWELALRVYKRLMLSRQERLERGILQRSADGQLPWDEEAFLAQTWKGLAQYTFHDGAFASSIDSASRAIAFDRTISGVHMIKALALSCKESHTVEEKQKLLDEALQVMKNALLYESPWDFENQQQNIAFFEKLRGNVVSLHNSRGDDNVNAE